MSSPVEAAYTPEGVGESRRDSRLGLLRSGTSRSHAPSPRVEAQSAASRVFFIELFLMALEPHVDGGPEAAARWERSHVDVAGDGLVAEVADLRIQPRVPADGEHVAGAEGQARALHLG